MSYRGTLISVEGIDGSGKSSAIAMLKRRLVEQGMHVAETREIGGTPVAERIRALVLESVMDPITETLLAYAARRDHVRNVILPALARGQVVLTDRFADSTFAYQGGGAGVNLAKLYAIDHWVLEGLKPDLTLFFDVDPETAERRRASVRAPDRFEASDLPYFVRVREAYLARIKADPARFVVIDSNQTPEQVWNQVDIAVEAFFDMRSQPDRERA